MDLDDIYRLLRGAHVQAQAIVDTVREPLLVLNRELEVITASRSFFETFRVGRDETLGRPLYELGNGQWNIPRLRLLLESVIPSSVAVEGFEVEHEFPDLGRRVMLLDARKLFRPDNHSVTLLLAIRDITQRHDREQATSLRMAEIQHRVKNLLAIVQALARQTSTAGRSAEDYRADFLGRLDALMLAHGLAFDSQAGTDLEQLVRRLLEPYLDPAGRAVLVIEADAPVAPAPRMLRGLALIIHELGTNAVKHGALSRPGGTVRIGWRTEQAQGGTRLRLSWQERGGPPVERPAGGGFGSRLIQLIVVHELDGEVELDYPAEGFSAEITVKLG